MHLVQDTSFDGAPEASCGLDDCLSMLNMEVLRKNCAKDNFPPTLPVGLNALQLAVGGDLADPRLGGQELLGLDRMWQLHFAWHNRQVWAWTSEDRTPASPASKTTTTSLPVFHSQFVSYQGPLQRTMQDGTHGRGAGLLRSTGFKSG
jgi:hypothetical protein